MAYLFGTNGTLLVTFTNPKPRGYSFGVSAAAVGSNLVIIGAAFDNVISDSAGAGYLFSTGGTLITAISNPAPAAFGRFSFAIAVAGNDQVLFGAPGNFSGAVAGAGAAYLFDLPPPLISIARTGGSVSLSWVTAETGLILEQTDKLGLSTTWSTTPESITLSDLIHTVQQPIIVNGAGSRFFRLRRP